MKYNKTYQSAFAALFAALSYAVFTFVQIKIPIGADMTSIHLGNAVVVLAALVLGGPLGGLAGAVGLSIGDVMDPVYLPIAPKTFLCKMLIGLIAGFIAHKLGNIGSSNDRRHILVWVSLAAFASLLFNAVADPVIGYYYKLMILGRPAASLAIRFNFLSSGINAIISMIVSVFVYMGLYPALRRQGGYLNPAT